MAKEQQGKRKKQKKAKCPQCGKSKLVKVRNKQERYCLKCAYIEPIPQAPDEATPLPIPNDQPVGELTEQPSEVFVGDDAKLTMDGDEIPLDPLPKDPAPTEAEHIANIKRRRAKGSNINRGMMSLREVTVHCWSRGQIRGFAYGTQCPYPNTVWSKKMSGVEAFNFLTKVKRANRLNKLESGAIISLDKDS